MDDSIKEDVDQVVNWLMQAGYDIEKFDDASFEDLMAVDEVQVMCQAIILQLLADSDAWLT